MVVLICLWFVNGRGILLAYVMLLMGCCFRDVRCVYVSSLVGCVLCCVICVHFRCTQFV